MPASPARRGNPTVTLTYAGNQHGAQQQQHRSLGTTLIYVVAGAIILFQMSLYMNRADEPALTIGTPVMKSTNNNIRGSSFVASSSSEHGSSISNSGSQDEDPMQHDGTPTPTEADTEEDTETDTDGDAEEDTEDNRNEAEKTVVSSGDMDGNSGLVEEIDNDEDDEDEDDEDEDEDDEDEDEDAPSTDIR